MKKNGFIAISLIYSFFIVFLIIIFTILAFYADNNALIKKINDPIMNNYNKVIYCSNCSPKLKYYTNVYDEYAEYTLPVGSYVYLPFKNYDGLFMVYDNAFSVIYSTYTNYAVKLISENPINKDTGFDTTNFNYDDIDYINTITPSYNENLASLIITDPRKSDNILFSTYGVPAANATSLYSENTNSGLYEALNQNYFYRMNFRYSNGTVYDGLVIPNCSCGSSTFLNYLYNTTTSTYNSLTNPNIYSWVYNNCSANMSAISSIKSCPIYFINKTPPASFNSYTRLFVVLKSNVVVKGGSGTKSDPYLLGVES